MSAFEKRWISPAEAASYLSLSAAGVRRLMRRGVIPNVKIGHSRRVDLRALDAELESQIEKSGRRGPISGQVPHREDSVRPFNKGTYARKET